jgi:hypothetical protein
MFAVPGGSRFGGGLEYLLASGFPANAIVVGWPVPVV